MAGGQRARAEAVGEVEHRVEAHAAVAAHARVRRQAGGVVGHPRVDDARAELVAQVERQVRQAHAVRERAGRADGADAEQHERSPSFSGRATARASRRRPRRRPARRAAPRPRCRRRRTSRRACGRRAARAAPTRATAAPSAPAQRVGGEVGGVELARAQAAERGGDVARCRGARRRGPAAPRTSSTAALAAASAAPQPAASKPASATLPPATRRRCGRGRRRRRPRPRRAPPGGAWPRPRGWRRWSSKRSSGMDPTSVVTLRAQGFGGLARRLRAAASRSATSWPTSARVVRPTIVRAVRFGRDDQDGRGLR